jgi:hypothetical protein
MGVRRQGSCWARQGKASSKQGKLQARHPQSTGLQNYIHFYIFNMSIIFMWKNHIVQTI